MVNWFLLAMISVVMFGTQSFLYKTSIEKRCNKFIVMFSFMATTMVLALVLFAVQGFNIVNVSLTILLGFLFGLSFFLKTIGQLKALDYLPTSKVFPITSMNVIVTVILALILFDETLGVVRIIGIATMILTAILIHQDLKVGKGYSIGKVGFVIALLAIIPASSMGIINKYAALNTSLFFFIAINYFFSVALSFGSYKFPFGVYPAACCDKN